MSNKPKSWKPLPGKVDHPNDAYARRIQLNGIKSLESMNNSRRQGSKPMRVMLAAIRHMASGK